MGLSVDGTLEFSNLAADPNAPQDGGVLLYVEAGVLKAIDSPAPGPGGSSTGGLPGAVWYDTHRPALVFLDTVATASQVPTIADLGIASFVIGDMVVRQADYELFEYEQTGQFSRGLVDTGTKWAGQISNGVPIGGAAGQILAKKSATDYDTQWINAPSGGGGSSGVTNVASMNTGARAYRTAALPITASTWTKVPFDTKSYDPGSHIDATGRYVVPSAGTYSVKGAVMLASTAYAVFGLYKNGVLYSEGEEWQSSAAVLNQIVTFADDVQCAAGDYLELWIYNGTATNLVVTSGPAINYFSVVQVDKALAPTSGGVSAGTTARAYRTAALPLAVGFNKIPLDTISADPGGHFNLTSGRYVAPTTGYYQVNGGASANTTAANQNIEAAIYKNGVGVVYGTAAPDPTSGSTIQSLASDVIFLSAGDYLELYCFSSAALNWNTGPLYGYLSVVQVDQALTPTVQPTTAARAYRNAAFNMPAGAWTKIPVDTVASDPGGHVSLTNSRYVAPVTGYYSVSISVAYTPTVAALVAAACYKNGAPAFKSLIAEPAPTAGVAGASASDIVFCNAGDYLELYGLSSAAAGLSIENTVNFISVVQVDQPIGGAGGNAVTPTTGARMYRNAAFTPAANTWTKVPLDTVGHDSGGHADIANSRYICPNPGWYQVNANASLNVGTAQTATTAYVGIAQNGTRVATGGARGSDNFNEMICTASDLLWCAGGDVLELDVFSGAGSPLFLGSNGNYLSVVQVDAPTPVASNTGAKAYGATTDFGTSISPGTWTKIHLTTAVSDPGGHFDLVTAFAYKATAAGWYSVVGNVAATVATAGTQNLEAAIFKNGNFVALGTTVSTSEAVGALLVAQVADLVFLNPGDSLTLMALAPGTTGGLSLQTANSSGNNYLSVVKVDQPQYANNPTVVAALPATPYDGQEIYFVADAANGVKWHLRYNAGSSSPHKWECLGGGAQYVQDAAQYSKTGTALTGAGNSLTLALAGDYEVELDAGAAMTSQTLGDTEFITLLFNGAQSAALPGWIEGAASEGASQGRTAKMGGVVKDLAAGTVMQAAYQSSNAAQTVYIRTINLRARPIRLG